MLHSYHPYQAGGRPAQAAPPHLARACLATPNPHPNPNPNQAPLRRTRLGLALTLTIPITLTLSRLLSAAPGTQRLLSASLHSDPALEKARDGPYPYPSPSPNPHPSPKPWP